MNAHNRTDANVMNRWLGVLLGATGSAMILYHLYYIYFLPYDPSIHGIVHLGFAFVVLTLTRLKKKFSPIHFVLLLASLWVTIFFLTQYDTILNDTSYPPTSALITGIIALIIVTYLTWESFGWVFPCITAMGVLYLAFGSYLPESFGATSTGWRRLITLIVADVSSPWGAYGKLLILSANYLFLFIFFGAALEAFGGMRFVMALGQQMSTKFRSGPAALAVFSSSLMGSVTGSTVANITIVGSFTIPMMKRSGYTSEQAAAIETASSSGGQILPPVMGATAFVLAGITGIPYVQVAEACVIPALIYFSLVLLYAELNARKHDIRPAPIPKVDKKKLLLDAPVFIVPLFTMMYMLIAGFSLMLTVFCSVLLVAGLGMLSGIRKDARLDWKDVGRKLMAGIYTGSQIAMILSLIGVLVATVEVSGLGITLGNVLVALGAKHLFLLLVFTAITCMILGVGVPSTAAYIICATMLSPALIRLGVPLLQAHLFPFYFAVFSHLTPPVGIGLMVACKMAGAHYLKAAVQAIKAAGSSFLLPFLFIYAPGILLEGHSFLLGLRDFFSVCLVLLEFSILLQNFWRTRMNKLQSTILILSLTYSCAFVFIRHEAILMAASAVLLLVCLYFNDRAYRGARLAIVE